MCGIIGCVGKEKVALLLLRGIKRLEYRGYDSVGMATLDHGNITVLKDVGTVSDADKKLHFNRLPGVLGIAHTRWATTGKVTKQNAHPHESCDKKIAVVHNGIIENYEELKKGLLKKGHTFLSETDTEVIAHYFEEKLKTKRMKEACVDFMKEIEGTFAILLIKNDENNIYALRRDSPLVLGICEGKTILASDIYAFSDRTKKAIFFDNDEFAVVSKERYEFYDRNGTEVKKKVLEFKWDQEESEQKQYDHFMMKEIMEQPAVVKRLLTSLKTDQKESFEKLINLIKTSHKIVFVASGTSYHATLLGAYYLHQCDVEAQTLIASEFEHFAAIEEDTLVIALSQSGETMDVIDALKYAQRKGAKIVAVVNVPYSSIQRMADLSINILAGQEVCVAATKSFVNQVTLLLSVAQRFGFEVSLEDLHKKITSIFKKIPVIQKIAHEIAEKHDIYVLGRGLSYPVAREIALKIKEISYIHAEGMMGGELKHGTIALIEEGTPVISLVCNHDAAMLSNTKEVEARGAKVIMIGTELGDIILPTNHDGTFGILATVVGQLLAYYIAKEKGLPIDRPRNLAKCVSVR